jgi:hypothetical protein
MMRVRIYASRGNVNLSKIHGTLRTGLLRAGWLRVSRVVLKTFSGDTFIGMRWELFLLQNGNDYTCRCNGRFHGWKHPHHALENQLRSGRGDF